MKPTRILPFIARISLAACWAVVALPAAGAPQPNRAALQAQFAELCDLARAKISVETNPGAFFIDSYAIRALCVAYDRTGQKPCLEVCKAWSDRMIAFQDKMIPRSAYYMNYNRKPGEDRGEWYVADSSSIAMGVLATAVRCQGPERQRYLDSAKAFAKLVMENYPGKAGGIRNGSWPKFGGEWWCSSGIFGSFAFLLYDETGDERYLKVALGALDWLNQRDLTQDETIQYYPLSKLGPTKPMYVLEAYSAGWPHLKPGSPMQQAALAQITWALNWTAEQQAKPLSSRDWPCDRGWGMKFSGLPFHQYIYSRLLPDKEKLAGTADHELEQLASVLFAKKPEFSQLAVFMMMSYSERLFPGAIYRNSRGASEKRPAKAAKE
jgi:hypothetical protein